MSFRHRFLVAAIVTCAIGAAVARGQSSAGAVGSGIPLAIKTATALPPGASATIASVIDAHMANLGAEDSTTQRDAREALIGEVRQASKRGYSPAFLVEYASRLNLALVGNPGLAVRGPMRARLNAAIVATRVAEEAGNNNLQPTVRALLQKGEEPIALWGAKAARFIIKADLEAGAKNPPLIKDVLDAARKFPAGPLVAEAYEALSIKDPQVYPHLLNLFTTRVARYQQGIPDEVDADQRPAFFLTQREVWSSLTPQQQDQVAQLIGNLLGLVAQHTVTATQNLEAQRDLAAYVGACLLVVGQNLNHQGLSDAARSLAGIPRGPVSAGTEIADRIKPVLPALKAAFGGRIKDPPAIK